MDYGCQLPFVLLYDKERLEAAQVIADSVEAMVSIPGLTHDQLRITLRITAALLDAWEIIDPEHKTDSTREGVDKLLTP